MHSCSFLGNETSLQGPWLSLHNQKPSLGTLGFQNSVNFFRLAVVVTATIYTHDERSLQEGSKFFGNWLPSEL